MQILWLVLVCILGSGELGADAVEDGEKDKKLVFKAINSAYMNVSCKGCFTIQKMDEVTIVEVRERVHKEYVGDYVKTSEGTFRDHIEIKAPLSPCFFHPLVEFIVYFKDEQGKRQNQTKVGSYQPEKEWSDSLSTAIESSICTKEKNMLVLSSIGKLNTIGGALLKMCLAELSYVLNSGHESSRGVLSPGNQEIGPVKDSDGVTIHLAKKGSKVFKSVHFTGVHLLKRRPECSSSALSRNATVWTVLIVVFSAALMASWGVCLYTGVRRRREAREGEGWQEDEEVNPDYIRGSSIYGHVTQVTDNNPDYGRVEGL